MHFLEINTFAKRKLKDTIKMVCTLTIHIDIKKKDNVLEERNLGGGGRGTIRKWIRAENLSGT